MKAKPGTRGPRIRPRAGRRPAQARTVPPLSAQRRGEPRLAGTVARLCAPLRHRRSGMAGAGDARPVRRHDRESRSARTPTCTRPRCRARWRSSSDAACSRAAPTAKTCARRFFRLPRPAGQCIEEVAPHALDFARQADGNSVARTTAKRSITRWQQLTARSAELVAELGGHEMKMTTLERSQEIS